MPVRGEELQRLVQSAYSAPQATTIDRAKQLIAPN
jgi:hypothetical protein